MKIDVCFSPALYPYYKEENDMIVVVVDVFRATTSMCTALKNGAKSIIPVATPEEAEAYYKKGYLVGGEENMEMFSFATFGNSPSDYSLQKVEGKDIVMSTTNGTRAIEAASDADCLLIGSFSNISSIADFCIKKQKDVLVLCAGWKDKFNLEDTLFGGALGEKLVLEGDYNSDFDAVGMARSMWREAYPDIMSYIKRSEHMKRMEKHGLLDVAGFCLESDTVDVLPVYNKSTGQITLR